MVSRLRHLMIVTALLSAYRIPELSAQAGAGKNIEVPPMPAELHVPSGNVVFRQGYAVGTQNYICQSSAAGLSWRFLGPQATLFMVTPGAGPLFQQQLATHFLSPNPDESGTPRATWQSSSDSSRVWARAIASSTDAAFVRPGAIPWLLLQVVGAEPGARPPSELAEATFIQRLNTSGGIAPSSGCTTSLDVGALAFVPYTTDYFFYKAAKAR